MAMALAADGKDLLLFDGDCGICTWCAEWVKVRDGGRRFEVKPYYEVPEAELEPYAVTWDDCTRAVHLITAEGRVWRGAFAVNATLWRMRGWRWLVPPLYILFPLLLVEAGVYALVAKNRHRISAAFGMNACRVRFDDDDSDDAGAVPEAAEVRS